MTRIDPPQTPLIKQSDPTNSQHNVDHQTPDDSGPKKEFEGEGFKDVYEDLTDVSIEALIAFLKGLIQEEAPKTTMTKSQPHQTLNPTTPNARAAMAYQALAPTKPAITAKTTQIDHPQSAVDKATANLNQAELKDMIRQLTQLSGKGHHSLSLQKSDSFLNSIRQAIQSF